MLSAKPNALSGAAFAVALAMACPTVAASLIVDGDFETFNPAAPDFSSDYVYPTAADRLHPPAKGYLAPEGTYDVTTDPHIGHQYFESFADHTETGPGNMLVVNGNGVDQTPIWVRTGIVVVPHAVYTLSLWMAAVDKLAERLSNRALLNATLNGVTITCLTPGSATCAPFKAPAAAKVWDRYSIAWDAGSSSLLTVAFWNANTTANGNDFALDDIELTLLTPPPAAETPAIGSPAPEPATWTMLLMGFFGIGGALRRRPARAAA